MGKWGHSQAVDEASTTGTFESAFAKKHWLLTWTHKLIERSTWHLHLHFTSVIALSYQPAATLESKRIGPIDNICDKSKLPLIQ
jgi:hypothetical protein